MTERKRGDVRIAQRQVAKKRSRCERCYRLIGEGEEKTSVFNTIRTHEIAICKRCAP